MPDDATESSGITTVVAATAVLRCLAMLGGPRKNNYEQPAHKICGHYVKRTLVPCSAWFVGGLTPSGASKPPSFHWPHWFSQKKSKIHSWLVLPQIEYWYPTIKNTCYFLFSCWIWCSGQGSICTYKLCWRRVERGWGLGRNEPLPKFFWQFQLETLPSTIRPLNHPRSLSTLLSLLGVETLEGLHETLIRPPH